MWKPSAKVVAQDYAQIIDDRGNGDIIIVWWLVPQMFAAKAAQEIMSKNVIFGVLKAHVSSDVTFSFAEIDHLDVERPDGTRLTPLSDDQIPPALAGTLAAIEAGLRQALGAMGRGIRWFVFDGTNLDSCAKGDLSVLFAGEVYTYETPIPGCP
ncbi:MAG TPA: hypothetical protein VH184_22625 [Dongiaceae bacterium]|jgi:hypothetical protein|nr:hypothetical protein [Dongiaceae bacterium]